MKICITSTRYFNKMNELYNGYIKGIERTNQLYTESIKNVDKMNELYREILGINLEWLNAFWKPWLATDWTKYENET